MTARVVAVGVGVLLVLGTAVALVREVTLALGGDWAWPLASWWRALLEQPSWVTTGVVALVLAVVGVALLTLALWPGRAPQRPTAIAIDTPQGLTTLSLQAVERTVRHSLKAAGVDVTLKGLQASEGRAGMRLRLEADMPAIDLLGAQAQAFAAIGPDLERLAGIELEAADLVVLRLLQPAGEKSSRS